MAKAKKKAKKPGIFMEDLNALRGALAAERFRHQELQRLKAEVDNQLAACHTQIASFENTLQGEFSRILDR